MFLMVPDIQLKKCFADEISSAKEWCGEVSADVLEGEIR